jgi:Rap guanine nucleotide exchange factor 4
MIINIAADKLEPTSSIYNSNNTTFTAANSNYLRKSSEEELILCEVRSNGERVMLRENDVSVMTGLSLNGRLFLVPIEHLDALTPLPEQDGPSKGTFDVIDAFRSKDLACIITRFDWDLFNAVHPYEIIAQVFGRHKFNRITANLDIFMKSFNEIQYWVVTEICLCINIGKRVSLLRKFIKVASW